MRQVFNPVGMCADPKVEPKPTLYPPTCTDEELINYVITYASTDLERELALRLSASIDALPVATGENCQCCGAPI
jgi:hypothetical protein